MMDFLKNMFSRAEGFGCMWVPFEFGSFNNMCLVFSLEQQKTNSSDQKQKTDFLVKSTFYLEHL